MVYLPNCSYPTRRNGVHLNTRTKREISKLKTTPNIVLVKTSKLHFPASVTIHKLSAFCDYSSGSQMCTYPYAQMWLWLLLCYLVFLGIRHRYWGRERCSVKSYRYLDQDDWKMVPASAGYLKNELHYQFSQLQRQFLFYSCMLWISQESHCELIKLELYILNKEVR